MYVRPTSSYGSLIPGSEYIRSLVRQGKSSPGAAKRLRWFDHYARFENARLTCRYFGISAQTFYRWKGRFDPYDLSTLEEGSRRPLHVRPSQIPTALVERVLQLRQQYPRWGKEKLTVLLKREGYRLSVSSVGRVLGRLKKRGVLVEPLNVRLARAARKRRWKPRYAVRKPQGWRVDAPGDLVQLDTLQIKLRNGIVRWQFSARDVVCRWDQGRAYQRPTSFSASLFLEYLERKFPFPVRAIQIDGGSEFKKHFEEACLRRGLKLFIIPVRSPKLQGHVERANRTHREEFYEVEDIGLTLEEHNKQLERWMHTYNTVRPHQSLDYRTPKEYYQLYLKMNEPKASLM